jgi:hypothetical protein
LPGDAGRRGGNGIDVLIGGTRQPALASDARLDEAWRALRGDGGVQFDLTPVAPEPKAPDWLRTLGHWIADALRPVGRAIEWLTSLMPEAPYARILLWTVLIAALVALAWLLITRWRSGEWRLPRWRRGESGAAEEEEWIPPAAPMRAWLEEADALAANGRFGEAVHHLLKRSIDDIAHRRPHLVRPALTSRDIAAAEAIPPGARTLFAGIVATVERSLFGGRPVSAGEWSATRETYANFAQTRTWRG